MPGSEPQTLKDVTSGLRMCVLQVTYLERKSGDHTLKGYCLQRSIDPHKGQWL